MGKIYSLIIIVLVIGTMLPGCQSSPEAESVENFVEQLPRVEPAEITRFQSADTIYFEHLGYHSIPLEDGSFLLYDRGNPNLLHLDSRGKLVKRVARKGKGPGEVLDILSIEQTPRGRILIYDQFKKKAIVFDEDLKFINEFSIKPFKGASPVSIHPANGNHTYLVELTTSDYLFNQDAKRRKYLAAYNSEQQRYGSFVKLNARRYIRVFDDSGQIRGATAVHFTPRQLVSSVPGSDSSSYLYWTGSSVITEVNTSSFDTLRSIPLNIPSERINSSELDTLREQVAISVI